MKIFILICFLILLLLILYHHLAGISGTFTTPPKEFFWNFLDSKPQKVLPKSKGENHLCKTMEEIFKKPFTTQRPQWLTSPVTGRPLELDCYNEELKIAAEYNGKQHYEFTPKFHKTYSQFRESQYRDVIKKFLCQEKGIKLLVVPYSIPEHKMKEYILNHF